MMKSRKKTDWLATAGISLMLTAVALMLWYFVHGETTVSGSNPSDETSVSLSCSTESKPYEYFVRDGSLSKKITVQAMFDDDTVKSISLVYKLNYDNLEDARASESTNHAGFNITLNKAGVSDKIVNPNYSYDESGLRFSLYVDASNYNTSTVRLFMIHGGDATKDMAAIKRNYENQGFECMVKS